MPVIGTCKLCRTEGAELLRSHYIPAGAYKAIRSSMGQSPVIIKSKITIKKDEQITDYVLCRACETRFNENGEGWIMKYCHQPELGFRLKEIIDNLTPIATSKTTSLYCGADAPEIDVEKIAYFVASIMWRGSVHSWRSGKDAVNSPSLGPYERGLRRYLLGEASFPENAALWISIVTDQNLWVTVTPPRGEKIPAAGQFCWRYKFTFLGLSFMFFLGKQLDPIILQLARIDHLNGLLLPVMTRMR